jgi:hypothetical protein
LHQGKNAINKVSITKPVLSKEWVLFDLISNIKNKIKYDEDVHTFN